MQHDNPRYQVQLVNTENYGPKEKRFLAERLKLGEELTERVLARKPCTLKKGLDLIKAQEFAGKLKTLGLDAVVVQDDGDKLAAVNTSTSSRAVSPKKQDSEAPAAEDFRGLHFRLEGRPDYAFLSVKIPAGETLKVEASAMATMDTNLVMKTRLKGGFSRLLSGESIFINDFRADGADAEIGIAPGTPGDMFHQYLDGQSLYLQNSAYVASSKAVAIETKWQGLTKGFFSGEKLFLIRATGKGDVWFNTYGAMIAIDVDGDYVVDTGHIVAFTEGLDYKISKVGGYKSLFFSGEGFVCRFSGKGKVWIQTRNAQAFAHWAKVFRPTGRVGV